MTRLEAVLKRLEVGNTEFPGACTGCLQDVVKGCLVLVVGYPTCRTIPPALYLVMEVAMHTEPRKVLRPDSKGRIALGNLAKGISSFHAYQDQEGRVVLEPQVEIPAREAWLWNNPTALAQVRQGLKEAGEGKLVERPRRKSTTDQEG